MAMSEVATRNIFSWALESHFSGIISAATLREAAGQFAQMSGGRGQVWLLDAGDVSDFENDTLPAIQEVVTGLMSIGLDRVAIVLPPVARLFLPTVTQSIPIQVFSFENVDDAEDWIRDGCPT